MEDRVRQVMALVLGVAAQEIDGAASTETIGTWDSVQHLNLVLALEEAFGVRFSPEETGLMTNYPEIVKTLARHQEKTVTRDGGRGTDDGGRGTDDGGRGTGDGGRVKRDG